MRPPSTNTVLTYNSFSSARSPSFFCSQLAIAERRSFSTRIAYIFFWLNFRRLMATSTRLPLIWLATNLIFRGDNGQFFSLATASIFYFLLRWMRFERSCRSKFSQLMTHHVFGYINRNEFISVMYCEGVTYKIRRDHRSSAPGFDHGFFTGIVHRRHFLIQF